MGELEEQLKESQDAAHRENGELKVELSHLHEDIQHYTNQLSSLQQRQSELEMALAMERRIRQQAEISLETLKRQMNGTVSPGPLSSRKKMKVDEASRNGEPEEKGVNGIICGKCNQSSRCECIEEFAAMLGSHGSAESLEDHSPPAKGYESDQDDNEIDFTARFASQRSSNTDTNGQKPSAEPSPRETDPCGFCRNDTECICAAIARDSAQQSLPKPPQAARQDSNGDAISSSCTNNPGTCAQCRSDPRSTVFCKTLAATRTQSNIPQTNGVNGLKTEPREPNATASGPTLSCADAFSALSRHHAFPQASEQLGSWVPQLTSVSSTPTAEGRTAFEIEAANVMSVLKFFDNRYGEPSSDSKDRRT